MTPDRESAYVSSIPPDAEEQVAECYPDGGKKRSEYWQHGDRVGQRDFHPTGELDYEIAFRNGVRHGVSYQWDVAGQLTSAEPYEDGVPHGTAYQWGYTDGRLIGSYTLHHGTGIDLWRQDWGDGSATLAEVYYRRSGRRHGFEWWLNGDQQSIYEERHWQEGERHGIEREWSMQGRLCRGYPRYWVRDRRVTKRQYLRAAAADATLPPYRLEENDPRREFPPEVAEHLEAPLPD